MDYTSGYQLIMVQQQQQFQQAAVEAVVLTDTTESYSSLYNLANRPAEVQSVWHYIWTLGVAIAYFSLVHLILHFVLVKKLPLYEQMTFRQRAEYRAYAVSPIHCVVACSLSIWGMFWVCGEDDNVYNNFECFNTPRQIHIWCLVHSAAYFFVDLIVWGIMRRGTSVDDKQMYVHHTLAFITFYLTICLMNFTTVFGTMLVFIEISTSFLAFRWLLFKHGHGKSTIAAVNSLCFLVLFFMSRIVFQIYISIWLGIPAIRRLRKQAELNDDQVPAWEFAFYIEMIALVSLSLLINIWWFIFIAQQAYRAFGRLMGWEPAEKEKLLDDKDGDIETDGDNVKVMNKNDNFNQAYAGLAE